MQQAPVGAPVGGGLDVHPGRGARPIRVHEEVDLGQIDGTNLELQLGAVFDVKDMSCGVARQAIVDDTLPGLIDECSSCAGESLKDLALGGVLPPETITEHTENLVDKDPV